MKHVKTKPKQDRNK